MQMRLNDRSAGKAGSDGDHPHCTAAKQEDTTFYDQ